MVSNTRSGKIHADHSRETDNTEKRKDVKGSTSKDSDSNGLEVHGRTKKYALSTTCQAGSRLIKRNSVSDNITRRSCRLEKNAVLDSSIKKDLKIEKTCNSPLRRSERIEKHNTSNSKDSIEKTISELIADRRMINEKKAIAKQEKYETVTGQKRSFISASTYVSLLSKSSKKCKRTDVSKMYEKVNDTSQGATITLGEDSPDDEKKIETLVKEAFSGDSFSISNNCKELSDVQHEQRIGQVTQTKEFCTDSSDMHQGVSNTLSSKLQQVGYDYMCIMCCNKIKEAWNLGENIKFFHQTSNLELLDRENIRASHMDEIGVSSGDEVEELDVLREQSYNKRENEVFIEDDKVTTKVDRRGNEDGICATETELDTMKSVISNVETDASSCVCLFCKHPSTILCCNGKNCNQSYHISCLSFPLEKKPPRIFLCSGVDPVSGGSNTEIFQMENCRGENQNSVNGLTNSHEPDDNISVSNNQFELRENVSKPNSSKLDSSRSRFLEFWVPVQLSNVQLEQYCSIMLSNSTILRSCSSSRVLTEVYNDVIFSTRKCCDHPYLVHASLQASLTHGLPQTEYLDIGIHACGKLELLDKVLHGLKQQDLRTLIIFHQFLFRDVRISIGDILDDFLRQRFGVESYERVDSGLIMAKKQASLQRFNDKENGRFVFLLENRACLPSIKLSAVDAVIIFGSDWNPLYDLKALNKISIDSQFEQIKVFRLYCLNTVEENILSLAKQDVILESTTQNLNRRCHSLLSLGASNLFNELDKFHTNVSLLESLKTFHQNSFMDDTVSEVLSQIVNIAGKTHATHPLIISKAQQSGTAYPKSISLFREKEIQLADVEPSQIFWPKLLDGRCPQWRYMTELSQRARRKVQQSNEESLIFRDENDEAKKKRKKVSVNISDPVSLPPTTTHDKKEESPELQADHYPKESELSKVSCGSGSLRDSQRDLHLTLKPELSKICDILHFSENVKVVLESFLDYIMKNLQVTQEPITLFQAFKLSLCWRAASFLKCKVDHKESLALVKKELSYECSETEAESVYSKLHMLKKKFPLQTNSLLKSIEPNHFTIHSVGLLDENKGKQLDPISLEADLSNIQEVEDTIIQKKAVGLKEFDSHMESQKQSLMLGNITSGDNSSAALDQVCSSGKEIVQTTGSFQTVTDPNPSIQQALNTLEPDVVHCGLLPKSSLPLVSNDIVPTKSNGISAQTSSSFQCTENDNIHVTDAAPVTQGENIVISQIDVLPIAHEDIVAQGENPVVSQIDVLPIAHEDIVAQGENPVVSQIDVLPIAHEDIVAQGENPIVSQIDVPPIAHEDIVAQGENHVVSQNDVALPIIVGAVEQNSHPVVSSFHQQLTPAGPINVPDEQSDLPGHDSDNLRDASILQQQSSISVTLPIFINARMPSHGLFPDPLENEKLRIVKELETAVQIFEDAKLRIRGQYDFDLDLLVKKYEGLIRKEENSFLERKKTLIMLQKRIHLNQILAKEFSHKFSDNSAAARAGISQGRMSSSPIIVTPTAPPNVCTASSSTSNSNPVHLSNHPHTLPQQHQHFPTPYSHIEASSLPLTATSIGFPNVSTVSVPNPNTNSVLVSSETRNIMQSHYFPTQYTHMAVSSSPMTATAMTIPNVSTTVSIPNSNPGHVTSQTRISPLPCLFRRSPHAQLAVSSSSFPSTHVAASNVSMHNSNLVCLPNQVRSIQHPNAFLKQNSQIPTSTSLMTTRTMASPNVSSLSSMPNSNLLSSQPRNNIISSSITTPTSVLPVQIVNHSSELFSNNPGRPNILQVGTATASPAPHLRFSVRPVYSNTPTIPLHSSASQHIPLLTRNSNQNMLAPSSIDPLFSSANENKANEIPGNNSIPAVASVSFPKSSLNQPLVPMDSNNTQPPMSSNSSIGRQEPQHLDLNRVSEAVMMCNKDVPKSTTTADKPVCLSSDED